MKIIIAGGRDFKFSDENIIRLNQEIYPVATEIISGGAKGADSEGERWAKEHDLPVTVVRVLRHKSIKCIIERCEISFT